MNKQEKKYLKELYEKLCKQQEEDNYIDTVETYNTGYKYGKTNGQLELVEKLLNIPSGAVCDKESR